MQNEVCPPDGNVTYCVTLVAVVSPVSLGEFNGSGDRVRPVPLTQRAITAIGAGPCADARFPAQSVQESAWILFASATSFAVTLPPASCVFSRMATRL